MKNRKNKYRFRHVLFMKKRIGRGLKHNKSPGSDGNQSLGR